MVHSRRGSSEMKMTVCSSCGFEMGNGKYCPKCGALSASSTPAPPSQQQPQQNWQQQPPPPQYGQQPQYGMAPQYGQPYPQRKDKTTAALLAIFLGGLGIHKFYLGGPKQKTAGIIQIVVTIVTCGFGSVLALIEGIIYLTKDEQQFEYEYVQGGKDWF
jgi:TM2 domain-containing membrane protein YozV